MSPSDEVNAATGAAPDLEERIAILEQELAVPSELEMKAARLAVLKRERAAQNALALQEEAKDRLIGIHRALGSLADQSRQDNARLLDAARKFAEQIEILNERYEKCIALRHEAVALAEAFDIPMPDLPVVVVPALRPAVQEAFETTCRVGVRDNGFVATVTDAGGFRTHEELGDLPGRDILRRKIGLG